MPATVLSIIVSMPGTQFRVIYHKQPNEPGLVARLAQLTRVWNFTD
jgi:hypothetical protein